MNSTNAFLREFRGCTRKVQFNDWQAAELKAEKVLNKYGVRQRPYTCPQCGYVHLKTIKESG